jgi:hypothetical protein
MDDKDISELLTLMLGRNTFDNSISSFETAKSLV